MRGPAEIPLGKLRDALMTTASANTGGKRDVGHERREGGKGGTGGQLAEATKVSARTAGHRGRVMFEFGTPMDSSPVDPGKQNNNNFKEKKKEKKQC